MLYTVVNTILLSSCAIYISVTRNLSVESDNALVFPQILAVIPGCFFTLARSVLLLDDLRPQICHVKIWSFFKVILASIFGLIGE